MSSNKMTRKAFTNTILCAGGCAMALAGCKSNDIADTKDLGSYCGLYCGSCTKYKEGTCPGCKAATDKKCKIRSCGEMKGVKNCTECPGFPCPKTKAMHENGKPVGAKAAANCKVIQEIGYDQWLEKQSAE